VLRRLLGITSLKANIIANFIGNAWSALLNIVFLPLYLKYIGAEGYGLIGIFASLQVVLSLLDSGLSTTLNKEIATLNVLPNKEQQMRNLVKTLGCVYWAMAILAGLAALCLSPFLAKNWVKPENLTIETITYAFILLSISITFQFQTGFYSGGLLGLQRQITLNGLRILFTTLRSVGALLVLIFISNSILVFFAWALLINVLQTFSFRYFLWMYLPITEGPALFDKQALKAIWRFAAGMTAIGLSSILLTQVDKIVLSKILPLDEFGYYTFSFTVASVTYLIASPLSQSYFPKFTSLLAEGRLEELKKTYHQGCQMTTLLVLPFALFLVFFSKEILLIWTNNTQTVENTWQMISVISMAVALHCLMFMPYILCLAYNNTKIAFYTNLIILIIFIPSIIFSAIHFGSLGGAVCWLIITIIYLCFNPYMVHRYFLKGEVFKWYWNDTIKPIIASLIILSLMKWFLSQNIFRVSTTIFLLAVTGILVFSITLMMTKEVKENIFKAIQLRLKK